VDVDCAIFARRAYAGTLEGVIVVRVSQQQKTSIAEPILSVRNLEKRFGGLRAVADVSFDVGDGTITALIGPNGAGKTTVFNLLTNLIRADAGRVVFLNDELLGLSSTSIAQRGLIRTFQSARVIPGMTVLENVTVGRHRVLKSSGLAQMLFAPAARTEEQDLCRRAEAMLELVGLARFKNTHAVDLPMGAQKVVEVVRALMAQPRLLCLDEPAAGLNDTETADLASLLRAVRETGVPVLVVEHNMSFVMNVADHVVVLDAGAVIASGTPAEVQSNTRVIEAYLGQSTNAAD
jgi:branched-chain amino acid transport system ATP-binding protein